MIKDIFPVQIYETHFDDYPNLKEEIVNSINQLKYTGHTHLSNSVTNALAVGDDLLLNRRSELPGIKELVEFIQEHLDKYWKELGYVGRPKIRHMWANQFYNNGFNHPHHHMPSAVSGCFYVHARSEMGNLRFQNPNELILTSMPVPRNKIVPGAFDHEVNVEDGKLVLFPSWLWHRTTPNTTDETRLIIAFLSDSDPAYSDPTKW